MILAIQTTYSAHGGIPTYNRTACRALAEWNKNFDGIEKRVLLVTDRPADLSEAVASFPGLRIEGFSGNRFALVRRAFAIALTGKIELLLVGHVNYAPLAAILKCLQPKLRYGVFAYGVDVWDKLTRARAHALRQADFVVCISEYTKRILIDATGVAADRIKLAPPSLEADLEAGSERQPIATAASTPCDARRITLLSVCRLELSEQYKGVDNVIKALPAVLAQYPEVQYCVIGSGSDLDRHKKLAQETGVAEAVHFLGSVDDGTLQQYYQKCDVFVMCSAREGFGIVYLEADEARIGIGWEGRRKGRRERWREVPGQERLRGPPDRSELLFRHSERDWLFALNLWEAWKILRKEKPRLILSTGAGPAVAFALVGKVLGVPNIFIETFTRVNRPSLTGRIMYRLADRFYYQWRALEKFFPKGVYGGPLV